MSSTKSQESPSEEDFDLEYSEGEDEDVYPLGGWAEEEQGEPVLLQEEGRAVEEIGCSQIQSVEEGLAIPETKAMPSHAFLASPLGRPQEAPVLSPPKPITPRRTRLDESYEARQEINALTQELQSLGLRVERLEKEAADARRVASFAPSPEPSILEPVQPEEFRTSKHPPSPSHPKKKKKKALVNLESVSRDELRIKARKDRVKRKKNAAAAALTPSTPEPAENIQSTSVAPAGAADEVVLL